MKNCYNFITFSHGEGGGEDKAKYIEEWCFKVLKKKEKDHGK